MSRQEQRFLEVIASSISDASYLGDDATWLDPPGILACADALVEGVHFPASMAPADIGWRTYAVNASDIAAMGGQVAHMLVTASLPKVCDESWIAEFCRGLAQGEARLVGGDLTGADKVYVSATLLGRPHATGIAWRSNCQPGHKIIVSGPVGQARAGLWAWQSQVQSHFPESVAA
jgi:thiamine-monophosphate kinase